MTIAQYLAKHLREVYFGKNWTWVSLKDTLADVTLTQATTQVKDLNTILSLTYHIHYYLRGQMQVLKGGPLEINDRYAFDHPTLSTEAEWKAFLNTLWDEMEAYAQRVEQLPESLIHETFVDEKYGTYYRNIQGGIEHAHYHLGQIVLLKKLI